MDVLEVGAGDVEEADAPTGTDEELVVIHHLAVFEGEGLGLDVRLGHGPPRQHLDVALGVEVGRAERHVGLGRLALEELL